ncbi:hypothetical protein CR513_49900, partial [Mucuna pruriens]
PVLEKQAANTTSWIPEAFSRSKIVVVVGSRQDRAIERIEENKKERMISILTQERLLGASLGVVLTGMVVLEQRRYIYASISNSQSQVREPIFGKKSRSEFAHLWNKTVDQTFGPLIKSISSRGW